MISLGEINLQSIAPPEGIIFNLGPSILRKTHSANWGKTYIDRADKFNWEGTTNVVFKNKVSWFIPLIIGFKFPYGIQFTAKHSVNYEDCTKVVAGSKLHYSDCSKVEAGNKLAYSQYVVNQASVKLPYEQCAVIEKVTSFNWEQLSQLTAKNIIQYDILQNFAKTVQTGYDIKVTDPLQKGTKFVYSIQNVGGISVNNLPTCLINNIPMELLSATLSTDESSPVWLTTLILSSKNDFSTINVGNLISLNINGEIFNFMVDGKSLSRINESNEAYVVHGISPLSLFDSPYAAEVTILSAGWAKDIVESVLGTVSWNLPNWYIPVVNFINAVPLEIARNIVKSCGGLIESNPDGTISCRDIHPVSVPDYSTSPTQYDFFDTDIFSSVEQIRSVPWYNRITISNGTASSITSSDRLETIMDGLSACTIRAYSDRNVTLTHTGDPATILTSLGKVIRVETERIEFKDGLAQTEYPITSIISATWQRNDLGGLTFNKNEVSSSNPGYSLLNITYFTESLNWYVLSPNLEETQFVLMDI